MSDPKEENWEFLPQDNKSKLEIDQKEYFFYLIGDFKKYDKWDFHIINEENEESIRPIQIQYDSIRYGFNYDKLIFYFKLIGKINSSIKINYGNNDKDFFSLPVKLSENLLLGFNKIYNNIENKFELLIKERNIVYTANLLNKFKCDINLMRPLIDDYKSDMIDKDEKINFEEFTSLLKIFKKFSNLHLFLNQLNLNNISIYRNDIDIKKYQNEKVIYDLIIKNPNDELVDIYLKILYQFDEHKFYKVLESGNIYKNSLIRAFKNGDIDMELLKKIIPEVIVNFSKKELNTLLVKYSNIERALNFILDNFEIIAENLKKRNESITFDLPQPDRNDDIKKIFEIHQKINEKQKYYDLINISWEKLIDELIKFNKDYDVKKLIDLKKFYFENKSIFRKILCKIFVSWSNNELVEIIHQTGINLSIEKKLKNSAYRSL